MNRPLPPTKNEKITSHMTLKEAIFKSLEDINEASNYKDIHLHIERNKYYDFGDSKTPELSVSGQLTTAIQKRDEQLQRIKDENGDYVYYLTKSVERKLVDKEFKEREKSKFNSSGYWIFFCNPKYWQIDEYLEIGESYGTWRVTDFQKAYFEKGQFALIRVGNDSRTKTELKGKEKLKPGIYGIVEILSQAKPMPNLKPDFWINEDKFRGESPRVKIRYVENLLENPILLSELKEINDFQNADVLLKGRQASSWSIEKEIFDKIVELANIHIDKINEINQIGISSFTDLQKIETIFSDATPRVKEVLSRRIERGTISKAVKKNNNYECQICKALGLNPLGFKKSNGEYYIETHHIIPVSKLEKGSLGILNLLTVCANHHRQLHYGDVKLVENNKNYFDFYLDGEKIRVDKVKIK